MIYIKAITRYLDSFMSLTADDAAEVILESQVIFSTALAFEVGLGLAI